VLFGADAARAGSRQAIGRPHFQVALGEVFGAGDALPDMEAAVVQAGHAGVADQHLERRVVVAPGRDTRCSRKGMRKCFISSQARGSQDEWFGLPM
jgi:hypothetical protein